MLFVSLVELVNNFSESDNFKWFFNFFCATPINGPTTGSSYASASATAWHLQCCKQDLWLLSEWVVESQLIPPSIINDFFLARFMNELRMYTLRYMPVWVRSDDQCEPAFRRSSQYRGKKWYHGHCRASTFSLIVPLYYRLAKGTSLNFAEYQFESRIPTDIMVKFY